MPNDTQEQVQDVPDWIRAGDLPNLDLFVTPDDLDSMQADIRKVEQGLALMRQYAEANAMR
jgi:hypothetical protein